MMSDQRTHAPARKSGRSSYIWAVLFAALIGAWLLSGQLSPAAQEQAGQPAVTHKEPELFKVSTRALAAEPRPARLILRGQTKSPARVQVRAETPGVVETVSNKKGALVAKDELLCKLKVDAREATLREATGALAQAESDYDSSNQLSRSGFTAKSRKRADKTRLEAARAAVARARLDLERIEVRAPFRGVIEDQPVKPGDYLRQADVCATLVKLDPILLTGAISERDLAKISPGMTATGKLITGESVSGQITFISPASDVATRTFAIEVTVPNPDRKIRAGVTTDIRVNLNTEHAHKVSASSLSLDDEGQVGLKIVDEQQSVRFVPVQILSNQKDGLWVSGLPEHVNVITVGHEYVLEGQKVRAVPETPDQVDSAAPVPARSKAETLPKQTTRTSDQPVRSPRKPKA